MDEKKKGWRLMTVREVFRGNLEKPDGERRGRA